MTRPEAALTPPTAAGSPLLARLPAEADRSLRRMFADPYLLGPEERTALVLGLRACVAEHPAISELRVLLGMALCVNLEVPEAIEELREGVRLAPESFIAQLKMGELWMRLRACDRAEEHTRKAGLLAESPLQAELAREQAARIRELVRKGIRRAGPSPGSAQRWLLAALRRLWSRRRTPATVAVQAP